MKRVQGQPTENTFEAFGFETLNEQEMNNVRGGGRPITRDKDAWPDEDE